MFLFSLSLSLSLYDIGWRRRRQRKKMPSRFLTLWSMLSKPAGQQQSPPKKKNKKDTQTPQVLFFLASLSNIKGLSFLSPRLRAPRVITVVHSNIYFPKFHCLRDSILCIRSFNCCAVAPLLRLFFFFLSFFKIAHLMNGRVYLYT